jgi:hypothetical protein
MSLFTNSLNAIIVSDSKIRAILIAKGHLTIFPELMPKAAPNESQDNYPAVKDFN